MTPTTPTEHLNAALEFAMNYLRHACPESTILLTGAMTRKGRLETLVQSASDTPSKSWSDQLIAAAACEAGNNHAVQSLLDRHCPAGTRLRTIAEGLVEATANHVRQGPRREITIEMPPAVHGRRTDV